VRVSSSHLPQSGVATESIKEFGGASGGLEFNHTYGQG